MSAPHPRRRIARALAIGVGALLGLVALAVVAAVLLLQGERLGRLVTGALKDSQGKVQIRSIRWPARALVNLLTDRPTPLWIDGVEIHDAEGVLVLEAPHLEVKVQLRSALHTKIYLHDLKLGPDAFWRFAPLKSRPEDNGFLTSFAPRPAAAAPKPAPAKPPDAGGGDSLVLQIVSSDLDGLTAVFDYPGAWGLELRNIKAGATLLVDGDFVGWDVVRLDARGGGYLKILDDVLPFDRVGVNRVATTRDWPNDIFLEVKAARTGRSTLVGKGFFTGIYGYKGDPAPSGIDMYAAFDEAADALAAVAANRNIPGLRLDGKGARLSATLKDSFARLRIEGRLAGLDVNFGSYGARGLGVAFKLGVDPLALTIDELGFSAPKGGRFGLRGSLKSIGTTGKMAARARLRLDRFTTDSYLPARLQRLAAGKVSGQLAVAADFGGGPPSGSVTGIDLAFGRAFRAGLPRTLLLKGEVAASAERVATSGLTVEIPGANAEIKGEVALARRWLSLALRASTSNLPQLLSTLGIEPLARGAALSLDVDGSLRQPAARGDAVVRGIRIADLPEVPELRARFSLADGTARLDSLSGSAFGGTLNGQGQVKLFDKTIDHMLRSPAVEMRVDGSQIEIASFVSAVIAHGQVDFSASAKGPPDKVRARLTLPPGASISLFGETWQLGGIEIDVDARSVEVHKIRLSRPSGAEIVLSGRMALVGHKDMSWEVSIKDVALEGLPWLAQSGVPVTGQVSAHLQVTGSLARPAIGGDITLASVTARGIALGDGHLVLAPTPTGGISVAGDLFHRFTVGASVALGPGGPRASAQVSFKELVLEELLPELVALGEGRGIASGTVAVDWSPSQPLAIDGRLTKLEVGITRDTTDDDGQVTHHRVEVGNRGDLHVTVAGDRITLDQARLVTDGGVLSVAGALDGEAISGALAGHLDLELLQPFVRSKVERVSGDLSVEITAAGTKSRPQLEGLVAIASRVKAKLRGFGPEVEIPSGSVRLAPHSIKLSDLAVTVDDATLTLRGEAKLDDAYAPTGMELFAEGEASARLLETLAPEGVSDASGKAKIRARIAGTPAAPEISAGIDLGAIEMRLRDLGRRVSIESGRVDMTSHVLVLREVRARIDDQGLLLIGAAGVEPGRVEIVSLTPKLELGTITLPLSGERIAYRIPGSVEIDDLGFTLDLTGTVSDGFALDGEVRVVSGRYIQDFTVRNLVISPRTNESAARPFYEDKPLLENLGLDLRVRTVGDSFVVQNNLAPELHLILDLHVGGTLAKPKLAGELRPTDGRFHIIGLRGDFELLPNVNHVTFVDTKSIAEGDTPELNLEAQNIVTDATGNEHTVRMRINGPIRQAAIDLSSDDGMDRNQALMLLLSGRSTEDVAQFGTHNPTVDNNVRSATDIAGQISRDSVSTLIEPYIDDTLELLTGRKLNLRPTVGADGFELKLRARWSRQTELQLSHLRGFQNQRRSRAEASLWLMDYLTMRGVAEQLTFSPQQGVTENINSARTELTLDYPIRPWWLK